MTVSATYERVSTRLQGTSGFSLGAQSKDAAQFAKDNGWQLPDELRFRDGEDRAASGSDWDLPGLNAMLDAAQAGQFSVLVVPTVDRFARDMTKALTLEQLLRQRGVRVVYINAPADDSAEGRLLVRQLQSFAEFEREKIALRTARGRREKIDRGQVLGNGPAPYGYHYVRVDQGNSARKRVVGLEVDPLASRVVKRIFKDAVRHSVTEIVDALRAEGIPPPPGYNRRTPALRWSADLVLRILTHPAYAGRMIYGGLTGRQRANLLATDAQAGIAVPAIVDHQLWDDVQRAMERRKTARRGRGPQDDPWLLRGLLTCGHCGGTLSICWNRVRARAAMRAGGQMSVAPYRQYKCLRSHPKLAARDGKSPCPMRSVRAEHIEQAVWQVVHDVLMSPDALRSSVEAARHQFDGARQKRQDLLDATDHEIRRFVGQIERIIDELLETPKGTESYRALIERQRRTEDTLSRLRADRSKLDIAPNEGISQAAVDGFAEFSQMVGRGLAIESSKDRRWTLEQLRVEGTIRMDPDGIRFGRLNHRSG